MLDGVQAAALLGTFIGDNQDRITRRAGKALKHELFEALSWHERRAAIPSYLSELGALLRERGLDAPRLWAEAVRPYGTFYFDARRDVGDLVREFKILQQAVTEEWITRVGPMEAPVAELLAECAAEGASSAVSAYVRKLRGEQIEFRESALIETILTHLDEGIMLVEADATFSFATEPALEMLGSELGAARGRALDDEAVALLLLQMGVRTIDGAPLRPQMLPAMLTLKTGVPPEPLLVRVRQAERERILEMGAIPIWQEGAATRTAQDLRGVINTVRDRTEDWHKTESLKRANAELADLHTRLLHRSRSQAMGELASGTAHALNNLLNPMKLRLRLLREAPTPEQLDSLERAIDDVAGLVARLQQFAAQRPAGAAGPSDLDQAVREALSLVRPEAQRAGEAPIKLNTELAGPPPVRANAAELREIVVSLLLYGREQLALGGALDLETQPTAGGARLRFAFRTGAAAPAGAVLLEPFLGGESPANLALAASAARESLARWGGALEARTLSDGAEFVLSFASAVEAQPAAREPEVVKPMTETKHRRVLVVDDDPDNAAMLAEVLAAEGHQTDTATTGAEAIAKWQQGQFDVALVDLLMPDMSGLEIAAQLRKLRPQALLAMVTGWELDAEQRRNAPVNAVFRKPVDLNELLDFLSPPAAAAEEPAPGP